MIDINKKYRTRDGRPARVLATDLKGSPGSVVAAISNAEGEGLWVYHNDGTEITGITSLDLIEISPHEHFKVDQPIIVYDNGFPVRRYFARVSDNGMVLAWRYGKTSWTAYGEDDVTPWRHCEEYEA